MDKFVVDTHTLFWSLTDPSKLGKDALLAFKAGEHGTATLHVPVIVLAELYYLNAKQGYPLDFAQVFADIEVGGQFRIVDMQGSDVLEFDTLLSVPEMHDRMIAGAALRLGCPLLTKDGAIVSSGAVTTRW